MPAPAERIKLEVYVDLVADRGFLQTREQARNRIADLLKQAFPQNNTSVKLPPLR